MKFLKFIFPLIVYSNFCFGQNLDSLYVSKINDTIASKILSEKRAFEIQLPRSFDKDDKIKYPLMIIMDGDHLFNMVSGTVDYLSYWGDIPENLVVGIKQIDSRFKDSSIFDNVNNTPITSTANFYDFIVQELIPGYTLHDRLLRPAMVGVSKKSQENQDDKAIKEEEKSEK